MYPRANLDRALAIRALRDIHGASRTAIRERLLSASDRDIRRLAEEAGPLVAAAVPAPSSARAYVARLQEAVPNPRKPPMPPRAIASSKVPATATTAGLEALLAVLEAKTRVPAGTRTRGTARYHIPITPDLELSVRGEISPQERAMLERVADLIRAILTGGLNHDDA
ncbi:hypothetical protein Rumeso_04397 [Rubellimicrobium mesophilum DSM 19309]|uniref:Uncharacterized protein n=1 Tax=Rubellimicrobium mesophilum DSM 19309 TaxID=442562 RepID=A0A017HI73_9RHOB|nr:hypothetical protein [Rubellimicrobium mesophilum]EYD74026.1 hypothetical protein Rumeso_04397 [Rubellimicrobium mesophilum DSM 19309]